MPIMLPTLDESATRENIRRLHALIEELDLDIRTYLQITTVLHQRRDALLESKPSHPPGPRKLYCILPSFFRWARSKPNTDLLSVEGDLKSARKKLKRLQRERREVEHTLRMHEAPFTPMTRLPAEVLEQIFLCSIPPGFLSPDIRQAPISLTLVCHKWRTLALSMPELWASFSTTSDWPLRAFAPVHVTPDNPQLDKILTNRSLSIGRSNQPITWIHRARNLPFRMEILIPRNDAWFGPRDPYRAWVLQTSSEWSHLRLSASAAGMRCLLTGPLSKLQTLELEGTFQDHYDVSYSCQADFDLGIKTYGLGWDYLTTLEASSTWILVSQLTSIINQSPALEICRAKILIMGPGSLRVRPRTSHSKFTTLDIQFRSEYAFQCIIENLILPSLITLRCVNIHPYRLSMWPEDDIVYFAKRSLCPLETFYARRLWVDDEGVSVATKSMLSVFPTLTHVDFDFSNIKC